MRIQSREADLAQGSGVLSEVMTVLGAVGISWGRQEGMAAQGMSGW